MQYFLAKSEPDTYSIDQLREDVRTIWDGVKSPQALQAIRAMKAGDRVFIYHSGANAGVAGMAEVASAPRPDPKNAKLTVVELKFRHKFEAPTPLRDIKDSGLFEEWALVRQGRLSTMSAPSEFVDWMRKRYPGEDI